MANSVAIAPETPRRFAIVGAGPSGLFAAERFVRSDPRANIDIFERLPTPHGLVRYGVAPDHQGTKAVTRVLERVLDKPNVRFIGNVEIGKQISLEALRESYDAVLLAIGACTDRKLGISGESLGNVTGSWKFIAWLNGEPGHEICPVDFSNVRNVVLVGLGNVAIDVARILLKPADAFAGSDIDHQVLVTLKNAPISRISIVGRGSASSTRFGQAELTELATLPDLTVSIDKQPAANDGTIFAKLPVPAGGSKKLEFRFGLTPISFSGDSRVSSVEFKAPSGVVSLPADLVVTCVGYNRTPFCELRQNENHFLHDENRISDGLYVTGWAATGARGTIASSRAATQLVADRLLRETSATGAKGLNPENVVDHAAWKRIDAFEVAGAGSDRCRKKIKTIAGMLNAAGMGKGNNDEL